uniref:Uncharacterized protein n=1 Tax=Chenopodium quinoa TaxID=63459 RepID=A0A803MCQ1_CHEQI
MGRGVNYMAMTTELAAANLINSDINKLKIAIMTLIHDATRLGGTSGFGTHFLRWLASLAAIYLLILDRTNWKTNMLTSLLVPYIFLSLPSGPFYLLSGEVGKWIAFVAVVLRLFFHRRFPGCYLLQEHIRATGGLRNSFTQSHGISNTIWSMVIFMI